MGQTFFIKSFALPGLYLCSVRRIKAVGTTSNCRITLETAVRITQSTTQPYGSSALAQQMSCILREAAIKRSPASPMPFALCPMLYRYKCHAFGGIFTALRSAFISYALCSMLIGHGSRSTRLPKCTRLPYTSSLYQTTTVIFMFSFFQALSSVVEYEYSLFVPILIVLAILSPLN